MMMFSGDERAARFIRTVEQMQAAEMMDMDYIVSRLTEDDGSIHYNVEIPDKDILSLIKRPSRIVLARHTMAANDGATLSNWKALMTQMQNRKLPEKE